MPPPRAVSPLFQNIRLLFKRNLITAFMMGFASGAPLLILTSLVQGWLTEAAIGMATIGLLAAAGIPYSLKFLWAPWLDYYLPPLFGRLGRRRGWIFLSQLALMAGLLGLSLISPACIPLVVAFNFFICFASATQDVVVDAYRREDLSDRELALGSAYYQWGYRLGMLAVSGGGLVLAEFVAWPWVFRGAALLMAAGPLTLLFSPEPPSPRPPKPASPVETLLTPLRDFFRHSAPWTILLFIFFYKFGDQLATSLNTAFFLKLGYSKLDIGSLVKLVGTWAVLAGVALGGGLVLRLGLKRCLWLFGFLQMVTTLGFVALYYLPLHPAWLGAAVCLENLAAGAGSSAFVAFMAALTNRRFSATQYALLSALTALPRTLLSSPAGFFVEAFGWPALYILGAVTALPGLYFLYRLTRPDGPWPLTGSEQF